MAQTSRIFIIAGPQSSGKTTVLNILKMTNASWQCIEETNPYLLKGKNHLGGAFVTPDLEMAITSKDLQMTRSLNRDGSVRVMETGIFHLVYLEHYCGKDTADKFVPRYIGAYEGLHPTILFIDTKPHISWRRRRRAYEERLDKAGVVHKKCRREALLKYKALIGKLYPLWLKYYDLLPFHKIIIKNSYKSRELFQKDVLKAVEQECR